MFHVFYQSYDFAARALLEHDTIAGTDLTRAYLAGFGEQCAA